MIKPLENQERSNPSEYINRINKPDPGHSATSRDFAYAIEEANRENQKKHKHGSDFGEDTYESAAEEEHSQPVVPEPERKPDESSDDRNLDVTV